MSDAQRLSSDRAFGFVMAAVLFGYTAYSYARGGPVSTKVGVLALLFAALAVLYPRALRWPNRAWTALGVLLGRVVNPVVLGLVFLLVVTPIAVVMRLARRDPLNRQLDPEARSYWIPREHQPDAESWLRQF